MDMLTGEQTAVFIFHADHSLVLATHPTIGSEFNALAWSSWLFTSFSLAGAATQTVFGKLSDIYGRKPIILLSYTGFAIGWYVHSLTHTRIELILTVSLQSHCVSRSRTSKILNIDNY